MTLADSVHQTRLHAMVYVARVGNVSQACRDLGISRTLFYKWKSFTRDTVRTVFALAAGVPGDILIIRRLMLSARSWPGRLLSLPGVL
jgi:hypothetical protein